LCAVPSCSAPPTEGKRVWARLATATRSSPEGEPWSPIVDAGPLHMHHRPRAASSRRQARSWVAREASPRRRPCRFDETRAPDERDPLEATGRCGWRESSKRSSASVGADAPFRGVAVARPELAREPKQSCRRPGLAHLDWAIAMARSTVLAAVDGASGAYLCTPGRPRSASHFRFRLRAAGRGCGARSGPQGVGL
jgi:hypothetical protein